MFCISFSSTYWSLLFSASFVMSVFVYVTRRNLIEQKPRMKTEGGGVNWCGEIVDFERVKDMSLSLSCLWTKVHEESRIVGKYFLWKLTNCLICRYHPWLQYFHVFRRIKFCFESWRLYFTIRIHMEHGISTRKLVHSLW
jgi:hypothetical protein